MGAVFVYGLYYERLSHITIGWDSDQNGCGFSPGFEQHPYLYWAVPPDKQEFEAIMDGGVLDRKKAAFSLLSSGVCVSKCPSADEDVSGLCKGNTVKMGARGCADCVCQMTTEVNGVDVVTDFRYDTQSIALYGNGVCLPKISEESQGAVKGIIDNVWETFKKSDTGQLAQSWMEDIVASWVLIALSSVTALVLGYVYLMIISLIGGAIIWLSIVLLQLGLLFLAGYCFYYRSVKYDHESTTYKYLTWAGYAIFGLLGVVFLFVCCCYQAI